MWGLCCGGDAGGGGGEEGVLVETLMVTRKGGGVGDGLKDKKGGKVFGEIFDSGAG